jgi:hypothetical protein
MALNFFLLMLGLKKFDISNMGLIFLQNSIPRVCGSFKTTDSTVSRLEFGYVTKKFKPFYGLLPQSLRACFERMRTNFVELGVGAEEISFS